MFPSPIEVGHTLSIVKAEIICTYIKAFRTGKMCKLTSQIHLPIDARPRMILITLQ